MGLTHDCLAPSFLQARGEPEHNGGVVWLCKAVSFRVVRTPRREMKGYIHPSKTVQGFSLEN